MDCLVRLLISVGIVKGLQFEHLEELYEGIYLACEKYGTDLAGGDTTSSLTGLTFKRNCHPVLLKKNVLQREMEQNPTI